MTTMPRRQGMNAWIENAQLVLSFNHFTSKFVAIKAIFVERSSTTERCQYFYKIGNDNLDSFIKETQYFLLN
jgi:hypothetical protein